MRKLLPSPRFSKKCVSFFSKQTLLDPAFVFPHSNHIWKWWNGAKVAGSRMVFLSSPRESKKLFSKQAQFLTFDLGEVFVL